MPNGNTAIESCRFGVELEVEGISTERSRRELQPSRGWIATHDGSLDDGYEIVSPLTWAPRPG